MSDYLTSAIAGSAVGPAVAVPQTSPVSDLQVPNNATGYAFKIDGMGQLNRFLMIGTQGGTFYVKDRDLTQANFAEIAKLIRADGMAVAQRVYEVSLGGLAHKQQPTLFVWALLLREADEATSAWVRDRTPEVARTGTMIMQLAAYIDALGGWGNAKKRAIGSFYTSRNPRDLAYQAAKYPSRVKWTHRDLLRKTHPVSGDADWNAVVQTILGHKTPAELESQIGQNALSGMARAHEASDVNQVIDLIRAYNLSWEMIPTQMLNQPKVWDELVMNSGYTALVRNLNRLTKIGWATPASANTRWLAQQLTDPALVSKSRVHPFFIYAALRAYGGNKGARYTFMADPVKTLAYEPLGTLTDALDDAFNLAFTNVEPTGLRYMIGIDCSGSMWWNEALPGVYPGEAAGVMALITLRTEENVHIAGFATDMRPLELTRKTALKDVDGIIARSMGGGTDCAAMFNWAAAKGHEFDTFITYTDNETWAGSVHPHVALQNYRKKMSIPARSLVAGMVANEASIADPNDPGMLDVCGLDASLPSVLRDFSLGLI